MTISLLKVDKLSWNQERNKTGSLLNISLSKIQLQPPRFFIVNEENRFELPKKTI
jgi:hypothetical protein